MPLLNITNEYVSFLSAGHGGGSMTDLHVYRVSGCAGLIRTGDAASFKGSYLVSPTRPSPARNPTGSTGNAYWAAGIPAAQYHFCKGPATPIVPS
jgi:hypothetical protein